MTASRFGLLTAVQGDDEMLVALLWERRDRSSQTAVGPQLLVAGGPNGAGKSTLVGQRLADRLPVVNSDDIARALPRRPNGSLDELTAGASGDRHARAPTR